MPMRRVAWMLLVCLMMMPLPGVAAEASGTLTTEELFAWRDDLWNALREAPVENVPDETNDPGGADTWLYAYAFGMATLTSPQIQGEENPIAEMELLTDALTGPRDVRVGDTLEQVLAVYPNENEALIGDAAYAVLYVSDEGAPAGWGWLMRRNRTVDAVEYVATAPAPGMEGFVQSLSVLYLLEDGRVVSIRVGGFDGLTAGADAQADLAAVSEIAAHETYTPGAVGAQSPFAPEDLVFSGMDMRTATPADAMETFGEPLEDTESDTLRTLTYAHLLIEFERAQGEWRIAALVATDPSVEGPRGLRVGDTRDAVFAMFGEDFDDDATVYQAGDASGDYALSCIFFEETLTEYVVYRI